MLEEVMEIARAIAAKAPLAIYGSKRIINYARDHSTADGLDYIGIWNASMLQPAEINEAFTAMSPTCTSRSPDNARADKTSSNLPLFRLMVTTAV